MRLVTLLLLLLLLLLVVVVVVVVVVVLVVLVQRGEIVVTSYPVFITHSDSEQRSKWK